MGVGVLQLKPLLGMPASLIIVPNSSCGYLGLLTQLPANLVGRQWMMAPNIWVLITYVGDPD